MAADHVRLNGETESGTRPRGGAFVAAETVADATKLCAESFVEEGSARALALACTNCGRHFEHYSDLERHQRVHSGERPFACPHCDKRFRFKSNLAQHLFLHTGRPFGCPHCERRFATTSNLATHLRVHSGEKPFPCSACDKRFAQRSSLLKHLRSHTGERPYACSTCDKRFSDNSAMRRHAAVHDAGRPFQCSFCQQRYATLKSLRSHVSNEHDRVRAPAVLAETASDTVESSAPEQQESDALTPPTLQPTPAAFISVIVSEPHGLPAHIEGPMEEELRRML
jgi:uncharacterized Zn-finger protein